MKLHLEHTGIRAAIALSVVWGTVSLLVALGSQSSGRSVFQLGEFLAVGLLVASPVWGFWTLAWVFRWRFVWVDGEPPSHTEASQPRSQIRAKVSAKILGYADKAMMVIAGLIGAAIGRYAWSQMWVPALSAFGIWYAAKRWLPASKASLVPPVAFAGGHLTWFLVSIAFGAGTTEIVIEVMIYAGLIFWLISRAGWASASVMIGYQALSLIENFARFSDAAVGTLAHQALLVHIALRAAVCISTAIALWKLTRPAASHGATSVRSDAPA